MSSLGDLDTYASLPVFHYSSLCILYLFLKDFTSLSCSLFRDEVWSMQIRSISWHSTLLFSFTILAVCKLQAVLINLVMTSNYLLMNSNSALFEEGKVQSEYGLTVQCIYVREIFIKFWGGRRKSVRNWSRV